MASTDADATSEVATYDGVPRGALEHRLGVPRAIVYAQVASTMDVAHRLAEAGAAAGTLVLADRQTAGRGRNGRAWASAPGAGIWLTLVERPADPSVLDILSVRLGLRVAQVLDPFVPTPVRVKWPNDLYLATGTETGKVGGILCEARWHGERLGWIAIGIGINLALPSDVPGAAGLPQGPSRVELLDAIVPALRAGAAARGGLTATEQAELAARAIAPVTLGV
jgi:BirA family biotin operon repressor/biotin-[acetyl-CoA-carboxylase] ligase